MAMEYVIDKIQGLRRSATAFGADWRRRRATLKEVDALGPLERGRVLGEAGLAQRDLADALQKPFIFDDLLSWAMQSLGIFPAQFRSRHRLWNRDMQRLCLSCTARSRCRRDLATGDFARRYQNYCANAASLTTLASGPGKGAP